MSDLVQQNTDASSVPDGKSGGIFSWLGEKLFLPDNISQGWAENDVELRQHQQSDASSTDIQARIDSSAAMAKSAQNVNSYVSSPFVDNVLSGSTVLSDVGSAAENAPSTLLNYTSDQILKPAASAVKGTVQSLIPWQIWVIVGVAVILGVGIFAFGKSKV